MAKHQGLVSSLHIRKYSAKTPGLLQRMKMYLRQSHEMLRAPSREKQLIEALRESRNLRERIGQEARAAILSDSVLSAQSKLTGAGLGLFASRDLKQGTGVALYPGTFFPSSDAWSASGRSDDSYLIQLSTHDNAPSGCIDARYVNKALPDWAKAHLINHPAAGHRPNVVAAAFFWSDLRDHDFLQFSSKINDGVFIDTYEQTLPSCVFITIADIRANDELFYDYRLRWANGWLGVLFADQHWHARYPSWYTPVDTL